jgi:hypothetical protein
MNITQEATNTRLNMEKMFKYAVMFFLTYSMMVKERISIANKR